MGFFNYFTDSERDAAQKASTMKNRLFGWMGPLLVKLHVPPDAISYVGLAYLFGVIIWFISHPYRAVVLLALYIINDGIDGAYARYLDRPTQAGAFTDIVMDQLGMVVITLGFLQYGMVDGQVGAYYIMIYLIMIAFSIVQNAQNIPMQYIFRSKYFLYGIYGLWAFTDINLAPYLLPVFNVVMTFSVIQSYLRLKRGIYFKYDLPVILEMDREIRANGGKPPSFWQPLNVIIPALVIVALVVLGAYNQMLGMIERADASPNWVASRDISFINPGEKLRAIGSYKDGWIITTYIPETRFSRAYTLDGSFIPIGTFRIPWALHRQHGICTDDENNLYIADRLSSRVFAIDIKNSLEKDIVALEHSFDTTLRTPVACVLAEINGTRRMLVAEYMSHYKTLVVDYEKAFKEGTAENAIVGWYRNMAFSRGLAYDGENIYEINGSLWPDIIYRIDPGPAIAERYLRNGIKLRIEAPRWHCRDIAINSGVLAMVDGESPRVFYTPLSLAKEK